MSREKNTTTGVDAVSVRALRGRIANRNSGRHSKDKSGTPATVLGSAGRSKHRGHERVAYNVRMPKPIFYWKPT